MGRSGYPFRDPNRLRPDSAGNQRDDAGNRRDDAGNRRDDIGNRRDDIGNRRDEGPNVRRDEGSNVRRDEGGGARREPRSERPANRPRPDAPASSSAPSGLRDIAADVEELLRMVVNTDVTELHVERGDLKITIRRGAPTLAGTAGAPAPHMVQPVHLGGITLSPETLAAGEGRGTSPAPASQAAPTGPPPAPALLLAPGEHLLTAPMVGTFYAASTPSEPPFVVEGDLVDAGQTVGIIEAMKIMNQIESEVTGRVVRILARDGQGVEYGQPLLVIEEA